MRRHVYGGIPEACYTGRRNTGHIENLFAAVFNHDVVNGGRSLLHHEVCHGGGNNVDEIGITGNNPVGKLVLTGCRVNTQRHTDNNGQNSRREHQSGRNPQTLTEFLIDISAVWAASPIKFGDNIRQPLNVSVPRTHFGV